MFRNTLMICAIGTDLYDHNQNDLCVEHGPEDHILSMGPSHKDHYHKMILKRTISWYRISFLNLTTQAIMIYAEESLPEEKRIEINIKAKNNTLKKKASMFASSAPTFNFNDFVEAAESVMPSPSTEPIW